MTSTGSPWHADDSLLRLLVHGRVGRAAGASVEEHLVRCAACRARLAALVPRPPLDAVWDRVRAAVERPEPGPLERLLHRLGVSPETGCLLAAVPAFRVSWLLGTVAALLFTGVAAGYAGTVGVGLFLLVAPLAPLAGVAAAYGPGAEPAYELAAATPYPAARLLLLRTAGVLATSVPLAVGVGLALPGPPVLAVAWLMPAVAFVAVCLALSPYVGVPAAGTGIALGWSCVVLLALRAREPLAVVSPAAQALFTTVAAAALVFVLSAGRRGALDRLGRRP